jgi:hypothetical protein
MAKGRSFVPALLLRVWCGEGDLNPHEIAPASTSSHSKSCPDEPRLGLTMLWAVERCPQLAHFALQSLANYCKKHARPQNLPSASAIMKGMTSEEFVRALKFGSSDSAADGTIKNLRQPPGRRPHAALVKLSSWFNQLSSEDQACVAQVARESAEAALFGVFCVLDGVRVIEDTPDKGDLELYFIKNGNRTLINDPRQEPLHDQFQSLRDWT